MQSSEASPVFSALSQPNGNRKASQLTVGRTGATDSGPRLVSTKELVVEKMVSAVGIEPTTY